MIRCYLHSQTIHVEGAAKRYCLSNSQASHRSKAARNGTETYVQVCMVCSIFRSNLNQECGLWMNSPGDFLTPDSGDLNNMEAYYIYLHHPTSFFCFFRVRARSTSTTASSSFLTLNFFFCVL